MYDNVSWRGPENSRKTLITLTDETVGNLQEIRNFPRLCRASEKLNWLSNISEAEMKKSKMKISENISWHLFLGFIYVIRYNMRASASVANMKIFHTSEPNLPSLNMNEKLFITFPSSRFPMLLNMAFHSENCTMRDDQLSDH